MTTTASIQLPPSVPTEASAALRTFALQAMVYLERYFASSFAPYNFTRQN